MSRTSLLNTLQQLTTVRLERLARDAQRAQDDVRAAPAWVRQQVDDKLLKAVAYARTPTAKIDTRSREPYLDHCWLARGQPTDIHQEC